MSRAKKLLDKARTAPQNLTFDDFCTLVQSHGFMYKRTTGSHVIYERHPHVLVLQPARDGKAKGYQVEQFLTMIGIRA